MKIYGLVQGVTFRYSAKKMADDIGISGYVCNEKDGSVFIEAEGQKDALQKFIKWCKRGPAKAKVEEVKIIENAVLKNFKTFESIHRKSLG